MRTTFIVRNLTPDTPSALTSTHYEVSEQWNEDQRTYNYFLVSKEHTFPARYRYRMHAEKMCDYLNAHLDPDSDPLPAPRPRKTPAA